MGFSFLSCDSVPDVHTSTHRIVIKFLFPITILESKSHPTVLVAKQEGKPRRTNPKDPQTPTPNTMKKGLSGETYHVLGFFS